MLGALHQVAIGLDEPVIVRGDVAAGASFSKCERYRYTLWRTWVEDKARALFIMLNPSTADESKLDNTVTRCKGYAEAWGYGGLVVCNIFAYRATKPEDMKAQDDPVGKGNDAIILSAARSITEDGGVVICAWSQHGKMMQRAQSVRTMLFNASIKMHYLRMGAGGMPHHPLYLPKDLTPTEWV